MLSVAIVSSKVCCDGHDSAWRILCETAVTTVAIDRIARDVGQETLMAGSDAAPTVLIKVWQ